VKPTGFIPLIGSVILDKPKHLFEKKNVFKIMYADSKTETFLAARSEIELDQWVFSLGKVQVSILDHRIWPPETPPSSSFFPNYTSLTVHTSTSAQKSSVN
jgi:hypothetical protein